MDPELRFSSLFRAHYDAIYRYALRRTDHATAEEVVSETLTVAWRRLADAPASDAAVRPWLLAIARRVLANADRSSRRASLLSARLRDRHVAAVSTDVADALAERQRILQVLSLLSKRDQEAMKLIGWDGLSITEAAAVLGCSRTALTVRLHRARQRLRAVVMHAEEIKTVDSENSADVVTMKGA